MTYPSDAELTAGQPVRATHVRALRDGVLAAGVIPAWAPNTTYRAGQLVVNPSGVVVKRKADGTSGGAYDPTMWDSLGYLAASSLWLARTNLTNVSGSPVGGVRGDVPNLALPDAATSGIGTSIVVPAGWASVDADVWAWNPGTTAGAIVLEGSYSQTDVGGVTPSNTLGTIAPRVTATMSTTAFARTVTTVLSGIPVNPAVPLDLAVHRIGADAADTFTGSVEVYGIMLRRVS